MYIVIFPTIHDLNEYLISTLVKPHESLFFFFEFHHLNVFHCVYLYYTIIIAWRRHRKKKISI